MPRGNSKFLSLNAFKSDVNTDNMLILYEAAVMNALFDDKYILDNKMLIFFKTSPNSDSVIKPQ